jgi:hypothetical protein
MIRIAALLVALMLSDAATACSCGFVEPAGFVHATLKRLPANARGALFLTPQGDPPPKLDAGLFSITSDRNTAPLKAILSYPDVGTNRNDMRGQRLVRIGPADGFQPGAHYTISYTGKREKWAYPTTVDFTIDTATVGIKSLSYQLVLDGQPSRQLLTMRDGRGSCASNQPVIAQRFHYVLPPALEPYREALAYFSEVSVGKKYEERAFPLIGCAQPVFATTALGDGKDLIQANCEAPGGDRSIRGQAGFLEVEDRLQATLPIRINLSKAVGKACNGMGMLKEALAINDTSRAITTACQMRSEQSYWGPFRPNAIEKPSKISARDLPSSKALDQLSKLASKDEQNCVDEVRRRSLKIQ